MSAELAEAVADGERWGAPINGVGWRESTGHLPTLLSPLRYPGAKRRMVSVIRDTILSNGLSPGLFVEPFAGGAGVALQLAYEGTVKRIALADRDSLVTSFWRTVFWDSEWLCAEVDRLNVTLAMWHQMRSSRPTSTRDRALKCLFLNRTSFSGIIGGHPGPIGGQKQASSYKIDCRFSRETIKARVRKAAAIAPRVEFVRCQRWQQTLRDVAEISDANGSVFVYADPPFMNKAKDLYRHYFRHRHHVALRDALVERSDPWLLSYDADPRAWALYCSFRGVFLVEHHYSISKASSRQPAWEMLVTNLARLPVPRPPRPRVATAATDAGRSIQEGVVSA